MGLILRPVKTHGFREYTQEVAADPADKIKAAEVDGDLDTVYTLVNGNLESANLSPAAAIVGTQLSGAAGIVGAQLAAGANIQGSQLAAAAGILGGQLAVSASWQSYQAAAVTTGLGPFTAETTLWTAPAITTRGGLVVIYGHWSAFAVVTSVGGVASATVRLKEDGVTIDTADHSLTVVGAVGTNITLPIPPILAVRPTAAGPHIYSLTLASTTAVTTTLWTPAANAGSFIALELS